MAVQVVLRGAEPLRSLLDVEEPVLAAAVGDARRVAWNGQEPTDQRALGDGASRKQRGRYLGREGTGPAWVLPELVEGGVFGVVQETDINAPGAM